MTELLAHLRGLVGRGHKLLVPYLMAGIPQPDVFADALRAVAASADAVEVGIPYSDPLMDGPVIAAAGQRAIAFGVGPQGAVELAAAVDVAVPRVLMTYYNPIHARGEADFCRTAVHAGFSGVIVPDLPLEESASLRRSAAEAGLAWVPLVAPTSPPPRVKALAESATGFLYAVSTLGVTGTRETLSERAAQVVAACRAVSDVPVLVGIGVSTPSQAVEAVATADGVVIGSAVVKLILEQGGDAAASFLADVRRALDGAERIDQ